MKPILIALFSSLFIGGCAEQKQTGEEPNPTAAKNIILMIGDGMGPGVIKAYRKIKDDLQTPHEERLLIDDYLVGSINTNSIDSIEDITDSAASATAYATGHKTTNGVLSLDHQGRPLLTVLEHAKARGQSTGLVVTSELTHATPAAFASHVTDREMTAQIADQYFDNLYNGKPQVDILLGGGLVDFKRSDRDLIEAFVNAGYSFADNRETLLAANQSPILGIFARWGLPKMYDRPATVPSLAEMTEVALKQLNQNDKGFFLLVEGSQIDWAAHDNDIVGVVSEMEDFSQAIKVVMDFAKQQQDTLVIITADHVTGGLSVGSKTSGKDNYLWHREVVQSFRYTTEKIVLDAQVSNDLVAEFHRATSIRLTKNEIEKLQSADLKKTEKTMRLVAKIISRRSHTGWTSNGHTGEDVNLYAYGPQSDKLRGYWDNTKIGQFIFEQMGEGKH